MDAYRVDDAIDNGFGNSGMYWEAFLCRVEAYKSLEMLFKVGNSGF